MNNGYSEKKVTVTVGVDVTSEVGGDIALKYAISNNFTAVTVTSAPFLNGLDNEC